MFHKKNGNLWDIGDIFLILLYTKKLKVFYSALVVIVFYSLAYKIVKDLQSYV